MDVLNGALDWLTISEEAALAGLLALLSASWVLWLGPEQKSFYKHWARARLLTIRLGSMFGHGLAGLLAGIGAQKAGWEPFSQVWANGLVYAAAAEGSIRANIAGLQISSASKVWSLIDVTAGRFGAQLEEHCTVKMRDHLAALPDDRTLATKVKELLTTAKVIDASKAAVYEVELAEANRSGAVGRSLLLRVGSSLALIILWKDA